MSDADAPGSHSTDDGTTDAPQTDHPVLLFDGVCNLCTGVVQWIVERDPDDEFRFASLQSEAGQSLLEAHGLPTDDFETFVLVEGDDYATKSTAALRVARRLGFPYSLLYPFVAVPGFVRDRVYEFVSEHRYEVFGKRESCMRPTPELEARFLDAGAEPPEPGSTALSASSASDETRQA